MAAGFAPAVAVGGVAVVQERLRPLDEGRDAELVQGARVTVGFTRAGPHVSGSPDGVELLAGHPGEQVSHPVAVVAADEFHVPLRLLTPCRHTFRINLGDRAADRVRMPRRSTPARFGEHHLFDPPGQVDAQRCGQLGELGRLVPGQVTGTDRAQGRGQPGVQRDAHINQAERGPRTDPERRPDLGGDKVTGADQPDRAGVVQFVQDGEGDLPVHHVAGTGCALGFVDEVDRFRLVVG